MPNAQKSFYLELIGLDLAKKTKFKLINSGREVNTCKSYFYIFSRKKMDSERQDIFAASKMHFLTRKNKTSEIVFLNKDSNEWKNYLT